MRDRLYSDEDLDEEPDERWEDLCYIPDERDEYARDHGFLN